jgi:hypothetical protein
MINFYWQRCRDGILDCGSLMLVAALEAYCYEVFAGRLAMFGKSDKLYRSFFHRLKLGYHFLVNGVRCLPNQFNFDVVTFGLSTPELNAVFEQVFVPCVRQFNNNILTRIGERASEIMLFQMRIADCQRAQRQHRNIRPPLCTAVRYLLNVFRFDMLNRLLNSQRGASIRTALSGMQIAAEDLFTDEVFRTALSDDLAQNEVTLEGYADVHSFISNCFRKKSDTFAHLPSYCLFRRMLDMFYTCVVVPEELVVEVAVSEAHVDSKLQIVPVLGIDNLKTLRQWNRLVQTDQPDSGANGDRSFAGRILAFGSHTGRKKRHTSDDSHVMRADVSSTREALMFECIRSEVLKKLSSSASSSVTGTWMLDSSDPAVHFILRVTSSAQANLSLNHITSTIPADDALLAVVLSLVALQTLPAWHENMSAGVLKLVRKTFFVQTGFYTSGLSWMDACNAWLFSRINQTFNIFEQQQGTMKLCPGKRDWAFMETSSLRT